MVSVEVRDPFLAVRQRSCFDQDAISRLYDAASVGEFCKVASLRRAVAEYDDGRGYEGINELDIRSVEAVDTFERDILGQIFAQHTAVVRV